MKQLTYRAISGLAGVLAAGTALHLPGVPTAAAALSLSLAVEAIYLGSLARKPHSQAALQPAQS